MKVSATMTAAMALAHDGGGRLIRMRGGFWAKPGTGWDGARPAGEWHSTPTIQALVKRGLVEYSKWQKRTWAEPHDTFPIEVTIKEVK